MASKLRVIIAGGGVAGLTLANALEKADIDYLLLEARAEIAPFVGASIALHPNGLRILDQLKCYDVIRDKTVPMDGIRSCCWEDGKLVRETDALLINRIRFGYPYVMTDRHFLLQTLYDNIQDKSRVLLSKRVLEVDHNHGGVSVRCKDGTAYEGDVVIGADGVHSIIRHQMWRHMDAMEPRLLAPSERTFMSAEYRCMFGVSKQTKGFEVRLFNQAVGPDLSFLWAGDKSGRVFWFIFEKMDKVYRVPEIPKYTEQEATSLAHRCLPLYLTDQAKFGDLWENRLSARLVPLEEAWYQQWSWGRFACIGDSVHKWTPNIGQGGNQAMESAAAAANVLFRLASSTKPLSHKEIEQALLGIRQRREPRAKAYFDSANSVTRVEAFHGFFRKFMALHLLSWLEEFVTNQISWGLVGTEKFEFLSDPPISTSGSMAFNQKYGPGTKKGYLSRVLMASPLLVLAYSAHSILSSIIMHPSVQSKVGQTLSSGRIEYEGRSWDLPTMIEPFSVLVTFFSPALLNIEPVQRLQAISFLVDLAPLWLIWILEGHRRANTMKLVSFPLLFGLVFQLFGIGVVGPIYFFLHYIQSPISDYAALDWRMVNVAAARTVTVAVFVAFLLPTLAMYLLPELAARLTVNAIWQAFPLLTVVLHYLLRKATVSDTTKHDRIHNVRADLPPIRFAVKAFAVISAVVFNWVRLTSPVPMSTIFFPDWVTPKDLLFSRPVDFDFVSGTTLFLQIDQVVCFAAAFMWLAYLANDLKRAEMIRTSWWEMVSTVSVGTLLVGPGAVIALSWLWREEILATKKAK